MSDTGSQPSGDGEEAPEDEASISKNPVGFNAIHAALLASMRGALPKLDLDLTTSLGINIGQNSLAASILGGAPKLDHYGFGMGQTSLGASILGAGPKLGIGLGQTTLAAALLGTPPKLDHLGFGIGQTSLAASILGVAPKLGFGLGQTSLAAALLGTPPKFNHFGLTTDLGFRLGQTSLGAAMGIETAARLLTLEQGFLKGTGTAADSFGEFDDVIGTDQELAAHLRRSVATTQRPGSFGFDYNSLRGEAAGLADRFVDEPELGRQVRSALEPVQEITGLTDELLIDYGELLGWWKIITRHKISTAGTILGYTIGLVTFIAGTGSGISSAPSALVEALIIGGGIYKSVHSAENDKP